MMVNPPKGYGLLYKGRLVCFFDVECDLEMVGKNAGVYNDSEETRQKALKMGANLVQYAVTH